MLLTLILPSVVVISGASVVVVPGAGMKRTIITNNQKL